MIGLVWWEVMKYKYYVTLFKCNFPVQYLYLLRFLNKYFDATHFRNRLVTLGLTHLSELIFHVTAGLAISNRF